MMPNKYVISAGVLAVQVLVVYLFVSAPPPLPEAGAASRKTLSAQRLFEICAAENASVRALYTREIVGKGKQVGLQFDENWRDPGVDAGPLPALFLRETATSLEKNPVRLGLFLGSDFPIEKSNLFTGLQQEAFLRLKPTKEPQYFFVPDLGVHTAMFPDLAVADPCVDCHNAHPDSPKTDWALGDVMGATTWTYPAESVSLEEALAIVSALRKGFEDAYAGYVEKAATFATPPTIGEHWPSEGYFLPSVEVFAERARASTSQTSMDLLLAKQ